MVNKHHFPNKLGVRFKTARHYKMLTTTKTQWLCYCYLSNNQFVQLMTMLTTIIQSKNKNITIFPVQSLKAWYKIKSLVIFVIG